MKLILMVLMSISMGISANQVPLNKEHFKDRFIAGDIEAGLIYSEMLRSEGNTSQADEILNNLVMKGEKEAMFLYGARNLKEDPEYSTILLEKAAKKGCAGAYGALAIVEENKRFLYLKTAAEMGDINSRVIYGAHLKSIGEFEKSYLALKPITIAFNSNTNYWQLATMSYLIGKKSLDVAVKKQRREELSNAIDSEVIKLAEINLGMCQQSIPLKKK